MWQRIQFCLIKSSMGSPKMHPVLNERIRRAAVSKEYTTDNIFHGEFTNMSLSGQSIDNAAIYAKLGQVSCLVCGIVV
jgi:hypothetical protein